MNTKSTRPDMQGWFRADIDRHVRGVGASMVRRPPVGVARISGGVTSQEITVTMEDGTVWRWRGGRYSTRKVLGCYAPLMPTPVTGTPDTTEGVDLADPDEVLHHVTVDEVGRLSGTVLTEDQAERVKDALAAALTAAINSVRGVTVDNPTPGTPDSDDDASTFLVPYQDVRESLEAILAVASDPLVILASLDDAVSNNLGD